MTAQRLLRSIRDKLSPALGDFALIDAEAILEHVLNVSRTRLYVESSSINIGNGDLARIDAITERRINGEPLPYILGTAYFYDREFFVDKNVLIPRPDTEVLVETILNTEKTDRADFIDIGIGSGILAAILTERRPEWSAVGIDVSIDALKVASRNINTENVRLLCGDLLTAVKPENQFDFIVSNPPYISSIRINELDKSVADHEPRTALYGGTDGLDYYRDISFNAGNYLKDNGRVYLEIGFDQGESVPKIFVDDGWKDVAVTRDLGGRDRVVRAVSRHFLLSSQ